mmetsp:Transcript_8536/g.16472  ORF Transcript_8536/g.16472 Transcript_8536/m.16472 type:complete len:230 (+) Transcript_8536:497-1186(+)
MVVVLILGTLSSCCCQVFFFVYHGGSRFIAIPVASIDDTLGSRCCWWCCRCCRWCWQRRGRGSGEVGVGCLRRREVGDERLPQKPHPGQKRMPQPTAAACATVSCLLYQPLNREHACFLHQTREVGSHKPGSAFRDRGKVHSTAAAVVSIATINTTATVAAAVFGGQQQHLVWLLLEADAADEHSENPFPGGRVRDGEAHLPVEPPRPPQRAVYRVGAASGADHHHGGR